MYISNQRAFKLYIYLIISNTEKGYLHIGLQCDILTWAEVHIFKGIINWPLGFIKKKLLKLIIRSLSPIKYCFMWKMYKVMSGVGKFHAECCVWSTLPKISFTAVRLFLQNRHLSQLDLRSSPLSAASEGNKWGSAGLCLGTMSGFFHICVIIDLSGNRHRVLATPAVREMRNQFSKVLLFNKVYLMTTKPLGKQLDLCHCATFQTSIIT